MLVLVTAACAKSPAAANTSTGTSTGTVYAATPPRPARAPVPAISPDSTPAWFAQDSAWTADRRMMRNIVDIAFREGATAADRQAVIDSLGAEVVGGSRIAGRDGVYYVRIPGPGGQAAIEAAVRRLSAMPHVLVASPHSRARTS